MSDRDLDNRRARDAWDANARFWDERMADGNDFFTTLVWPAVEELLRPQPDERLLDVACGNGVTSRLLARAGASVVGIDFSNEMIRSARERAGIGRLDYRVVDATDAAALRDLGAARFDGALCNMALMDLADTRPLMTALATLLRPRGRFVFSVLHPCFNSPAAVLMGELQDRDGAIVTTYSVKISRYLTPYTQAGLAMVGQPVPHPYFHRPLAVLFREAFESGLVIDALEECAFPPESISGSTPLSWNGRFNEIPPVLIARMRPRGEGSGIVP
jgi:2-polyprenyl-3-methyl-5-hydroxy-6-metoxy-1,4-benzoquinol methylase